MPRKQKEIREAALRDLNQAANNVPDRLKSRILPLKNDLPPQGDEQFYNWRGFTTDEFGVLSLSYEHGKAANDMRRDKAMKKAFGLLSHYGEEFWNKSLTIDIAKHAGVGPRTVRNYRSRLLALNGKAK